MIENNNTINPATGEPVTEQAPAVDTTSTTEVSVLYTILIPNENRSYTFEVFIDPKVYDFGWRDAEIERIVTGTHHVTVCAPEYWDGTIDEKVNVTCDAEGRIVLHKERLTPDDKEDTNNG